MGEAVNSGPLVPYDYSSEEEGEEETVLAMKRLKGDSLGENPCHGALEEETLQPKKRLKGDSLGVNSYDGGSSQSFPDEVYNPANLCDNINPETGEALSIDDEYIVYDEDDWSPERTDHELLHELAYWELKRWEGYDRKRREVYYVCVDNCDRFDKSGCLELLKKIGCEKRFICCSVDKPGVFYARLLEKEAAKLKGLKEIFTVEMYKELLMDA